MNRNSGEQEYSQEKPVLESLFNEVAGMNFIKKRLQQRCFPKNIQNYKNSFFIELFRWLLLNGKMEKVKNSKLRK